MGVRFAIAAIAKAARLQGSKGIDFCEASEAEQAAAIRFDSFAEELELLLTMTDPKQDA